MIITPTSNPNPTLKLMLLQSVHGRVVRDGLRWQVVALAPVASNQAWLSELAFPLFELSIGRYAVTVTYAGSEYRLGEVELASRTCTDVAFYLPAEARVSDDYFFDYDAGQWFACRSQERELQSVHGFATLPLRDPNQTPTGEQGIQLMSHPLLRDAVQFDGLPPDIRPEPSQNRVALELTLAQRLAATPSFLPAPTPTR